MRSAHMIIQRKFLYLAAYEGFVLNTSTLDIEQQLTLVPISMQEVNVNYVNGYPMISSHINNKEAMKQNILYPIRYSIITLLNSYMTSKQSLHLIYQFDIIF